MEFVFDWEQEEKDDDAVLEVAMAELVSSSEEEAEEERTWGGSTPGRRSNKKRDFQAAYAQLLQYYFNGTESTYDERDFERRFRVPRDVFNLVYDKIVGVEEPFVVKKDAVGRVGIHPLVRLVACFRHIGYGDALDREDENLRLSESSLQVAVQAFCKLVVKHFGAEYLNRSPSDEEKLKIHAVNTKRGFPGLFASWDCKHFIWHRCPMVWAGQYSGHALGGQNSLILEAIADYQRYIWYVNFGDAGSANDINTLDRSSIVGAMLEGSLDMTCPVEYEINGTRRDWMYYLTDGIYPEWGIFVKTFSDPRGAKQKVFSKQQEFARKDVECAFGILVKEFHILAQPLLKWYLEDITDILECCIILHNMSIALTGNTILDPEEAEAEAAAARGRRRKWPIFSGSVIDEDIILADGADLFAARSSNFNTGMQSSVNHYALKRDLTEHLYSQFG